MFGNTFNTAHMYCRHNSEKLGRHVQTPLPQKPRNCFPIFIAFLQSTSNLVHFEKKGQLQSLNISEVIDSKKYGYLNARKSPF